MKPRPPPPRFLDVTCPRVVSRILGLGLIQKTSTTRLSLVLGVVVIFQMEKIFAVKKLFSRISRRRA